MTAKNTWPWWRGFWGPYLSTYYRKLRSGGMCIMTGWTGMNTVPQGDMWGSTANHSSNTCPPGAQTTSSYLTWSTVWWSMTCPGGSPWKRPSGIHSSTPWGRRGKSNPEDHSTHYSTFLYSKGDFYRLHQSAIYEIITLVYIPIEFTCLLPSDLIYLTCESSWSLLICE